MKRILSLFIAAPLALVLIGCPSSSQQKVAQAVDNISIIVSGLQQSEVAAHNQQLIPDEDHVFIQQQMIAFAGIGKTADSCIRTATNTAGDVACINTVVTEVDSLNASGALHLKSATAKQEFQTAMASIKTVLVSIEAVIGPTTTAAAK